MIFKELDLKGAFEIQLEFKEDVRGFFMRTYDNEFFKKHGLDRTWVQESESFSRLKGTIRGLHLQLPPHTEAKIVRVLTGEVFFAVVDLRKDSPTFAKWASVIVSEENKKMIYVPEGLALGMMALTDNCRLHYKIDRVHSPESAWTIKWDDSDLAISWPLAKPAAISEKDANAKSFKDFLYSVSTL